MKVLKLSVLGIAALSVATAGAAPVKLDQAKMDSVSGGKITQVNNGGHEPNGEANGIPAKNPTGKAPPGQNK